MKVFSLIICNIQDHHRDIDNCHGLYMNYDSAVEDALIELKELYENNNDDI